jgi:hypothetical protein
VDAAAGFALRAQPRLLINLRPAIVLAEWIRPYEIHRVYRCEFFARGVAMS